MDDDEINHYTELFLRGVCLLAAAIRRSGTTSMGSLTMEVESDAEKYFGWLVDGDPK